MSATPDPFPAFSAALSEALGDLLALGAAGFLDMVAEDVVMEFPYARPGGTPEVAGRPALAAYLGVIAGQLSVDRVDVEAVHRCVEPGVTVIEFTGEGRGRATGAPYRQRYISVVRVADGRIRRYRDYWNPLALQGAFGQEGASEGASGEVLP